MNAHDQPFQAQNNEEMLKKILAVAQLLSKGIVTEPDDVGTEKPGKKLAKTQDTKVDVSS
jgi:hypothetical protein